MPNRVRHIAALLVVGAVILAGCGTKDASSGTSGTHSDGAMTRTQPSMTPAPASCQKVGAGESLVATATRDGTLSVYAEPTDAAASRTLPNPRLINNDPRARVPLTLLVKDFPVTAGCGWIQVFLPVRPNGSTGWIKASDVALATNPYRLEVLLNEFKLRVFKDGRQINEVPVGVARDNTPTPGGLYYTTELIKTPDPSGAYGPFAFGLSGFSDMLTTFAGGPGQLGIHGTNEPAAIGSKVSHGCIRMSNDNITALARVLPLGTPVQVTA